LYLKIQKKILNIVKPPYKVFKVSVKKLTSRIKL
jgi:hypothetical protein